MKLSPKKSQLPGHQGWGMGRHDDDDDYYYYYDGKAVQKMNEMLFHVHSLI